MTREKALKIIKEFINGTCLHLVDQEALETLIPELKENENEKIIKTLQEYVKNRNWMINGPTQDEVLVWLEKQKKHQENCTKFLAKILKHSAEGFRNVLKKKGIDYIPHESFWTNTAGTFSKQECNEFYKWMDDMTMELVTEETPEYKKGFKAGRDFEKQKERLADTSTILLIKKEIERRIETWQNSRKEALAMGCNTLTDDAAVRIEELYNLISFLGTIRCSTNEKQKEQKHYWKPTETDVALFNKAVTTNKALTPTERAQLDIMRSKFGCCHAVNCSGIVQKEQKPADDKAFEEWINSWFKEHKEKAYPQITMDEKEFKNFCRGIKNMYQQKSDWSEEDEMMRENIISDLQYFRDCAIDEEAVSEYEDEINWLKDIFLNHKKFNEAVEKLCSNEWNEEDKEAFDMCINVIPKRWRTKSGTLLTNWLKEHLRHSWKSSEEQENIAERFARIVRENLIGIDKEVQQKFEHLYFEVSGNKMYGGYND